MGILAWVEAAIAIASVVVVDDILVGDFEEGSIGGDAENTLPMVRSCRDGEGELQLAIVGHVVGHADAEHFSEIGALVGRQGGD